MGEDRSVDLALKYMDLARAEILARIKSSNDTLIVYAGALGAIAAWLYKPENHTAATLSRTGLIVGFLSLAASWIVYHNEKMVVALACYQKEMLAPVLDALHLGLKSWETSDTLKDADTQIPGALTSVIYGLMVAGPSVVAWYEMHLLPASGRPGYAVPAAGAMALTSVAFLFLMGRDRWALRKKSEPRTSRCPDVKIADG